jgi:transcription antitermination protein NusB
MTSRRGSRRQAIDVLYQADITGSDPRVVLAEWHAAGRELDPFAEELVEGVTANRAAIDEVLSAHSEHWKVDRMASVDRTILRLAVFELLHRPDVPAGAAIDEAVRAAKELSTEDSGRFVNGVLGKIAAELVRDREQPDPA